MAEQLNVPPTRGSLLRVREQMARIQGTHDLLDRKRQALLQELLSTVAEAEAVEEKAREEFQAAHEAMQRARMRMGRSRVRAISLTPTAEVDVEVRSRSIMGVDVPRVTFDVRPLPAPYGPGDTSPALDEARETWLGVVRFLGQLVEATNTVWRLAQAMRKTQRQVNALEATIPRYRATIDHIELVLAEEQREDVVFAKKVKEKKGGK